jgi:hypothetical protein
LKYLRLYKINYSDKERIYNWRKKKIVNNFFLRKKITKQEHHDWFKEKMNSKKFSAWIISYCRKKIGLTQIDKTNDANVCKAGIYTISKKYSFLTFEIMNIVHQLIFIKLKFKKISSYIAKKNINFRKLNKYNGYKECNEHEFNNKFIYSSLKKTDWLKSKGFFYFKKKYGKL